MKRNPLWLAVVLAVLTVACGQLPQGHAASILGVSVSLADLIDGDPVEVGDKQFSNFDYTPSQNAPSPDEVTVVGVYDSILDGFGLQFSGDFSAGFLNPPFLDAGLSFEVEALDPNLVISDVHLVATTAVFGTGSAGITEVISGVGVPGNTPSLKVIEQVLDDVSGPNNATSDEIFFPDAIGVLGFKKIRVTKDIRVQAGPGDFDTAEVTTFRQVFTQLPVIPEPGTISLMAMGMLVCVKARRRQTLLK